MDSTAAQYDIFFSYSRTDLPRVPRRTAARKTPCIRIPVGDPP